MSDAPKNVFIDRHERSDMVKYYNRYWKEIEAIKPYLIEFKGDSSMKSKVYLKKCAVRDTNWQPIFLLRIVKIFSMLMTIDNKFGKKKSQFISQTKSKGKEIMVSDSLLPWFLLNLLSLSDIKQIQFISSRILLGAVGFLLSRKNNE